MPRAHNLYQLIVSYSICAALTCTGTPDTPPPLNRIISYKLVEQKRPQSNLISLRYNFYAEMHCGGKWIHKVNKCWSNLSPI